MLSSLIGSAQPVKRVLGFATGAGAAFCLYKGLTVYQGLGPAGGWSYAAIGLGATSFTLLATSEPAQGHIDLHLKGFHVERYLPSMGFSFASGALDGVRDALLFHYDDFQRVHPGADPTFWDPSISWTNKGGITYLNDGVHFLSQSSTWLNGFSGGFLPESKTLGGKVLKSVLLVSSHWLGKTIAWKIYD